MTARRKLFVNFDGLCEPANPAGIPCYGFVVTDELATLSYREYGLVDLVQPFSPQANSNTAEYGSAIRAMEWLLQNGYAPDSLKSEWIKRDENREADKLAKEAYYWALRKYPTLRSRVRKHWATMLWLEQVLHKEN